MLARFFIDRPIFAWVISIVIVAAGLAAVFTLPIAQYPEITPPTVQVACVYPGANAKVVADTVAAPIEQQVNGVEKMLYMSSQSNNDGSYNLTVTFELGVDLNMAQVLVQNRVNQAMPTLPDVVKATGVTVNKKSPSILLVVNLYSDDDPATKKPRYDQLYLSNYATIQLKDELARVEGVGDVLIFGQQDYSMRVWVDPEKLASRGMTADDIVRALREQNVQVAAGQIGQPPVPRGQDFQYTMTTLGRLAEAEQFADVVIKSGAGGEVVYLKDVARLELGAKSQTTESRLDGKPSAALGIFQLPGSNALAVAEAVRAKMKELRKRFPSGMQYTIVYDTTPFIDESVNEVFVALGDAVVLVALVVLLFLQDWKAMILPLIDVAVSLIGTFAIMKLMGFTLNNLTLLGLVLAIGIVVDDAIVVLENIERHLAMGKPVRDATIDAMNEITGTIIAITLVLASVFLPSAFIPGITGQFYKQFALTISVSMIISAINAMTLTPARATAIFGHRAPVAAPAHGDGAHAGHGGGHEALPWWGVAALGAYLLFKVAGWIGLPSLLGLAPAEGEPTPLALWGLRAGLLVAGAVAGALVHKPLNRALGVFFKGFNRFFEWVTNAYGKSVAWSLRVSVILLLLYVGLIGLTGYSFTQVPTGFIPSQDKGYLIANIQLPDASSLERTRQVVASMEKICRQEHAVSHTIGIPGQSFVLNSVSSNFGSMFIILKPFDERHGKADNADEVVKRLRQRFYQEIREAQIAVFGAPAVDGLGNSGGFKLMVEDRGDVGLAALQRQADNLARKANQQPGFVGVFSSFRDDTPQLYVDINRVKCKTMGVELNEVFNTLQVFMGGYYVNDFNRFGRTWQVNVQAEDKFRLSAESLKTMKVRNGAGEMVPLGTVIDVQDSAGPVMVTRYKMYPAAALNGATLPGVSTGQVIEVMGALSEQELPPAMASEWTELIFLQTKEGIAAVYAFLGAVLLVFLVLAALYESWALPLAIILVVPMCLLSAIAGVAIARLDINIFVQVGFVVLIGLAAKNAILIVVFARERRAEGMPAFEATVEACKVRLRPIVMTSIAFIMGILPLVQAHGAGAEMRYTLGVGVFAGMIGVTIFGIYLTPVFFYVIEWFIEKYAAAAAATAHAAPKPDGQPAAAARPLTDAERQGIQHKPG